MSIIDRVNHTCEKARRDGKFSFTIECSDWEPIHRFMVAEIRRKVAIAEKNEALQEIED